MDSTFVVSVSGIVFSVIVSVVAGGAIASIIRRISQDKVAVDYAEKLYQSFPPATQDIISRLADTLDATNSLIKEIVTVQTPPPPQ